MIKPTLPPIREQQERKQPVIASITPDRTMETPKKEGPLHYLSTLKSLLTALVILHHTAIAYGGAGQIFYHDPGHQPGSEAGLVAFNAVNQTFFMAGFFFVAGFLSRRSLSRRMEREDGWGGVGRFLRDRVWRLGGPTVVYSVLGPAVCEGTVALGREGRDGGSLWEIVWEGVTSVRGVRGPVWFCALLLIFDVLLAVAFWMQDEQARQSACPIALPAEEGPTKPTNDLRISSTHLVAALTILTVIDLLWRLLFPVGTIWTPLNLNLGYLAQYIAAYSFGIMVADPVFAIPSRLTLLGIGVISLSSGTVLISGMPERLQQDTDPTGGGMNVLAAAYAVWNNFQGYLIASGLLRLFSEYVNYPCRAITDLAYLAFLLHLPVSTAVEVSLESWQAGSVTKTACIGLLNVVATWATAWVWQATSSAIWQKALVAPSAAVQSHSSGRSTRRRTFFRGERAIEILEGLDEVGCR